MLEEEGGSDRSRWKKCIFGRFGEGGREGEPISLGEEIPSRPTAETIFLGKKMSHCGDPRGRFSWGKEPEPKIAGGR